MPSSNSPFSCFSEMIHGLNRIAHEAHEPDTPRRTPSLRSSRSQRSTRTTSSSYTVSGSRPSRSTNRESSAARRPRSRSTGEGERRITRQITRSPSRNSQRGRYTQIPPETTTVDGLAGSDLDLHGNSMSQSSTLSRSGGGGHGNSLRPLSLDEAVRAGSPPPPLRLDDRIVWLSDNGPEFGVIKWLGKLPDVSRDWMAGVKFDNPVGSGTGLYNEHQLFQTELNHASLVPVIGLMKAEDFGGATESDSGSHSPVPTPTSNHMSNGRSFAGPGSGRSPRKTDVPMMESSPSRSRRIPAQLVDIEPPPSAQQQSHQPMSVGHARSNSSTSSSSRAFSSSSSSIGAGMGGVIQANSSPPRRVAMSGVSASPASPAGINGLYGGIQNRSVSPLVASLVKMTSADSGTTRTTSTAVSSQVGHHMTGSLPRNYGHQNYPGSAATVVSSPAVSIMSNPGFGNARNSPTLMNGSAQQHSAAAAASNNRYPIVPMSSSSAHYASRPSYNSLRKNDLMPTHVALPPIQQHQHQSNHPHMSTSQVSNDWDTLTEMNSQLTPTLESHPPVMGYRVNRQNVPVSMNPNFNSSPTNGNYNKINNNVKLAPLSNGVYHHANGDLSPRARQTASSSSSSNASRASHLGGLNKRTDPANNGEDFITIEDHFDIGSMVKVVIDDIPCYGYIKWLGRIESCGTDELIAGLELEDELPHPGASSDGSYGGRKYFDSAPNRGYFAPISELRRDMRFSSKSAIDGPLAPPPPVSAHSPADMDGIDDLESSHDNHSYLASEGAAGGHFGSIDCPAISGEIPPLKTAEDLQVLCGKNRGIQGHHNSCYLDATLFAMFSCSTIFESLLLRPRDPQKDIPEYDEVQRILKEDIVNPLRANLYVRADRVMKLRTLLERLTSVRGLTSEEKDPEEFLNLLLNEILKADPYLKLSSGLESFFYQLFVEKDEKLILPTVQQLFDQSFLASELKLSQVPPCLLIQMPRFGRAYKMYPRIVPSLYLDVTDVMENSPRTCAVCGSVAEFECKECFGQFGEGLDSTAFCGKCMEKSHAHRKRSKHRHTKLKMSADEFSVLRDRTASVPRVSMELFAVLCIETSHYVSFVKCGSGPDAPWCFFDSMADRKGEQNGYNIPEITPFPDLKWWLSDEGIQFLLTTKDDKLLPEMARRLLCDAYMCFYQSPDSSTYNR